MLEYLLIGFLVSSFLIGSQKSSPEILMEVKNLIQKADNEWDYNGFVKAKSLLDGLEVESSLLYLSYYYQGLINYKLAIFHIQKKERGKAKKLINDAIKILEASINLRDNFSESHALLGTLLGMKISFYPFLSPFLGYRSFSEFEIAINSDSKNPRNYLLRGITYFHTPSIFGGGISNAKNDFEYAIKLFEEEKKGNPILPSWGLCEAYTWLGLCYLKNREREMAKETFLKGLEKCPEYKWLKLNLDKIKEESKK